MKALKISIVMCTYNGAAYLREQLDSLVAQTLPFYELVVQDDGSTDGTWELLENYRLAHPDRRIRLFRHPERLGYNRNFLTAVQRAEGDCIACCDQDDIWLPEKLEVLAHELGRAPLVFHNSMLVDNNRRELGLLHNRPLPARIPSLGAVLYPRAYGHQILFRRELCGTLAAFVDCEVSYDYLIATIAAARGALHYVHRPLVLWRRHAAATTLPSSEQKAGKWAGYKQAIAAWRLADNRERTRRYFSLLRDKVPFADPRVARAVCRMGRGRLFALLAVGWCCLWHSREAVPDVRDARKRWLRAFFLPLFFVRDHGRYILR